MGKSTVETVIAIPFAIVLQNEVAYELLSYLNSHLYHLYLIVFSAAYPGDQ